MYTIISDGSSLPRYTPPPIDGWKFLGNSHELTSGQALLHYDPYHPTCAKMVVPFAPDRYEADDPHVMHYVKWAVYYRPADELAARG